MSRASHFCFGTSTRLFDSEFSQCFDSVDAPEGARRRQTEPQHPRSAEEYAAVGCWARPGKGRDRHLWLVPEGGSARRSESLPDLGLAGHRANGEPASSPRWGGRAARRTRSEDGPPSREELGRRVSNSSVVAPEKTTEKLPERFLVPPRSPSTGVRRGQASRERLLPEAESLAASRAPGLPPAALTCRQTRGRELLAAWQTFRLAAGRGRLVRRAWARLHLRHQRLAACACRSLLKFLTRWVAVHERQRAKLRLQAARAEMLPRHVWAAWTSYHARWRLAAWRHAEAVAACRGLTFGAWSKLIVARSTGAERVCLRALARRALSGWRSHVSVAHQVWQRWRRMQLRLSAARHGLECEASLRSRGLQSNFRFWASNVRLTRGRRLFVAEELVRAATRHCCRWLFKRWVQGVRIGCSQTPPPPPLPCAPVDCQVRADLAPSPAWSPPRRRAPSPALVPTPQQNRRARNVDLRTPDLAPSPRRQDGCQASRADFADAHVAHIRQTVRHLLAFDLVKTVSPPRATSLTPATPPTQQCQSPAPDLALSPPQRAALRSAARAGRAPLCEALTSRRSADVPAPRAETSLSPVKLLPLNGRRHCFVQQRMREVKLLAALARTSGWRQRRSCSHCLRAWSRLLPLRMLREKVSIQRRCRELLLAVWLWREACTAAAETNCLREAACRDVRARSLLRSWQAALRQARLSRDALALRGRALLRRALRGLQSCSARRASALQVCSRLRDRRSSALLSEWSLALSMRCCIGRACDDTVLAAQRCGWLWFGQVCAKPLLLTWRLAAADSRRLRRAERQATLAQQRRLCDNLTAWARESRTLAAVRSRVRGHRGCLLRGALRAWVLWLRERLALRQLAARSLAAWRAALALRSARRGLLGAVLRSWRSAVEADRARASEMERFWRGCGRGSAMAAEGSARLVVAALSAWRERAAGCAELQRLRSVAVRDCQARPLRSAFCRLRDAARNLRRWRSALAPAVAAVARARDRSCAYAVQRWRGSCRLLRLKDVQREASLQRALGGWRWCVAAHSHLEAVVQAARRGPLHQGFQALRSFAAIAAAEDEREARSERGLAALLTWRRAARQSSESRRGAAALGAWRRAVREARASRRLSCRSALGRWRGATLARFVEARQLDLARKYAAWRLLREVVGLWLLAGLGGAPRGLPARGAVPATWSGSAASPAVPALSGGRVDRLALWASMQRVVAAGWG